MDVSFGKEVEHEVALCVHENTWSVLGSMVEKDGFDSEIIWRFAVLIIDVLQKACGVQTSPLSDPVGAIVPGIRQSIFTTLQGLL